VMKHILFKTSFPAEFHAQTAVEAAFKLYPEVKDKWDQIEKIEIDTHESAVRIIDKKGPLNNPADRDHCLQYMVAIALLKGNLKAEDYEAESAADPKIDKLREKMVVREHLPFSKDYLDPDKRSIANKLTVTLKGKTLSHTQEYPLGHRRRRKDCIPELFKKYEHNIRSHPLLNRQTSELLKLFYDRKKIEKLPVTELMALFTPIGEI
ncbi:MAG: 2-methylcitrate dehydratase, partial [Parachlamydiaceae bacterium]